MALIDHLPDISSTTKHIGDIGAVGITIATLFSWLPGIAALLTVVWTLLRIYESILNLKIKRKELRGD